MTATTISDTERREVARRLRGIKDMREGCGHDMCCDLWSAIFDSDYRCTDLCDECEAAVLNSLADLIDTDTTTDTTKSPDVTTKCDREALLVLADDVDGAADDSGGFEPLAGMLRDIARCIREACGEVVG